MEYRKGCPACEHTDPQLERELQALAQLLVDSFLWSGGVPLGRRKLSGIDNPEGQVRLKGVDNPTLTDE